ncbi:MAG: restriction endonuclease subunit S [Candidatus Brocadia sp.]|nr:restriction endonuclease subunit S [Candidatus Brocadia sp.]
MSDLPKGWDFANMQDILEFNYGKGLPEKLRNKAGSVIVPGSNGVVGKHDKAITSGPTIIVGRKGSVGKVSFCLEGCWPGDTTYYIDKFPCNVPPKYWMYYLKFLRLGQHHKSSAIPGLNRKEVYNFEVPLPPIPEQRRIVAKLERLLHKVDACKERLEKIPQRDF